MSPDHIPDAIPDASVFSTWRKSSYSGGSNGSCVEVAHATPSLVPVRDSKAPHGPALLFAAEAWASFVAGVKAGDFPAA